MWNITKDFDFCYGHRVWSQQLNTDYSIDGKLACRHLHGHQGKVSVVLSGESLTNGMVTDFKHLNWFKKWLDDNLDHKFIVHKEDPLFNTLFADFSFTCEAQFAKQFVSHEEGYWTPDLTYIDDIGEAANPTFELYEGLVVVPFVPTSENLSKWLFDIVDAKMKKINIATHAVVFDETPKSHSTYVSL